MKNFEKYIDKIVEHLCLADALGENTYCAGCKFRESDYTCNNDKVADWLLEEYQEPIQLTHDEYVILENLVGEWECILRDKQKGLFLTKPIKDSNLHEYYYIECFNHMFTFIKELETYSIQKLIDDYKMEHGYELK
jgi:hypothetical protein